jgi:hypothetical protein
LCFCHGRRGAAESWGARRPYSGQHGEKRVNKIEAQAQPSGKAEVATDDTLVSDARMKIGRGGISSLELNRE